MYYIILRLAYMQLYLCSYTFKLLPYRFNKKKRFKFQTAYRKNAGSSNSRFLCENYFHKKQQNITSFNSILVCSKYAC